MGCGHLIHLGKNLLHHVFQVAVRVNARNFSGVFSRGFRPSFILNLSVLVLISEVKASVVFHFGIVISLVDTIMLLFLARRHFFLVVTPTRAQFCITASSILTLSVTIVFSFGISSEKPKPRSGISRVVSRSRRRSGELVRRRRGRYHWKRLCVCIFGFVNTL